MKLIMMYIRVALLRVEVATLKAISKFIEKEVPQDD